MLHAGLPSVDKLLEEPYLLSENSMHFLNPADTPSHDPQSGRPPPNPANSPPQLQNYLANDSRYDAHSAQPHPALLLLTDFHMIMVSLHLSVGFSLRVIERHAT